MITYYYSAHSAFAYLGSEVLMRIAGAADVSIVHKPMDLRRVVDVARGPTFTEHSDAHIAYFFGVEIDRWTKHRNAPVMGHLPRFHHHEIETSNCLLIAAMEAGENIDRLAHTLLQAHWRDDADLADEKTLVRLAESAGFDGDALSRAARSDAVKAIYKANTQEAIDLSVFGSPTYLVGDEMFYGQDRLEFVEAALAGRA